MSVAQRLEELGIEIPPPPPPVGMYRAALRSGNWLLVSGQLPMRDGELVNPGHIAGEDDIAAGREAARVATLNALAAVQAIHGSLEGLRVVRLVGYVASAPDFTAHPAVINGASELLLEVFGEDAGLGTRLALGAAALPLGAAVEIDLILEDMEAAA